MSLKDDLIKHQIFIQRLGANHAEAIKTILNRAINFAINSLTNKPEGLSKKELRALHTDVLAITNTIKDSQLNLLVNVALYEAEFITNLLLMSDVIDEGKIPSPENLKKAISNTKMSAISGATKVTIPSVYKHFARTKASEITLAVGDASLEAADQIEERGTNKLLELGAGLFAVQALTLASTTTTQSASSARQEVYEANNIPFVDWVTELDSDVCEDCEALGSGGPYPADDVDIPPEHWNCRCVLVPTNE